jgi:cell division protein FtsX
MGVDASRGDIDRVRRAIQADDDVERFAYLDHRAALAELRRIFRRNHELRDGVLARDLPVSFRLQVRNGALDTVEERYEPMASVDTVVDGSSNEANAWSARQGCSRTAYDLEVFMDEAATPRQITAAASLARQAAMVVGVEVADANEVRAIFDCLRSRGAKNLPDPPPAILHVDVDDPAHPAFEALQSSLLAAPGVGAVLWDPYIGTGI